MAWDLRAALLKKEEFESARLQSFDFRRRARTMRLLASELGIDPQALTVEIAERDDAAILARVASRLGQTLPDIQNLHQRLQEVARRQLITEIGDPTPHRLA